MNAYELADEFKNRNWDEVDCVLWCEKSANMLRQQADRIAELEKVLDWIATVNAMDYEYQNVAKSVLKERHGIK